MIVLLVDFLLFNKVPDVLEAVGIVVVALSIFGITIWDMVAAKINKNK